MMNDYDELIQNAAEDHLPGFDWRLLKAQLLAESALNPHAKSRAGAEGIAQFMPKTWDQIAREMGLPKEATPYMPEFAIPASAYYMRKLWDAWTAERLPADRYCLALASYNAGMGNILKAQKKAGMVTDYKTIIRYLEQITGQVNSIETRNYVHHIFGLYSGLLL